MSKKNAAQSMSLSDKLKRWWNEAFLIFGYFIAPIVVCIAFLVGMILAPLPTVVVLVSFMMIGLIIKGCMAVAPKIKQFFSNLFKKRGEGEPADLEKGESAPKQSTVDDDSVLKRAGCEERVDQDNPFAAANYVGSSKQKGQTCKLYALQLAMKQTSSTFNDRRLSEIPPVCASDDREYQHSHPIKSLRKLAKDKGFSSVGEIPSTEMLREIGRELNYEVDVRTETSLKGYIETLAKLIDDKLTPCVYFDVSLEPNSSGMPQVTTQREKNEHAAVAVGYFTDKTDKKKYFILRQWGEFYTVDAEMLYRSSSSLSKAPRAPESFYKLEKRWANFPSASEDIELIKQYQLPTRTTRKNRVDETGCFNACILTVRPLPQEKAHKRPRKVCP